MPFTLQEIIKTWNAIYKTDIVLEFEDFINALEDLEVEKESMEDPEMEDPEGVCGCRGCQGRWACQGE